MRWRLRTHLHWQQLLCRLTLSLSLSEPRLQRLYLSHRLRRRVSLRLRLLLVLRARQLLSRRWLRLRLCRLILWAVSWSAAAVGGSSLHLVVCMRRCIVKARLMVRMGMRRLRR